MNNYVRDNDKPAKFTTIQKIARVWAFNFANELKIKLPVNRKILVDRIRACILANNPKNSNGFITHGTLQKYFLDGQICSMPNVIREAIEIDDLMLEELNNAVNLLEPDLSV